MGKKASYEELERRVAELEAQSRNVEELQNRLKRNLSFTESLLDATPIPVFWKDTMGRYQGCNAAFMEIVGVEAEQIKGKTAQELWPHSRAAVYHQKDLELIAKRQRQVFEFTVIDKDRRVRPVIHYRNVFFNQDGTVAGLVGSIADVSDVRRAQLELQTLFSMSLDMICIADIETATFLKVNPAFTTTLGYSEEELLSVPFTEFVHPDDIDSTQRVMTESLKKGEKVINFKNRYRCKNGQYRYINWVSHPVAEEGVTYAVAHDVTEEMRAYETLQSQRDLLNSLFDNLPVGITVWSADSRLMMINKGFVQITGYTREDIMDLPGWFQKVFKDPEDRFDAENKWLAAKESADTVWELAVTCRDGRVRNIEFHGAFLKDGRSLVTLADITGRRQAQDEIHRRRKFLESVLYHAPDAIVTLDENHRVVDWNPGAVRMFGYNPEEVVGFQLDDLVARHEQRSEAGDKTLQVLSGQRVEAFETVRYRKDGTPIHVIAAGSPILVEGELKGAVAVYTDITEHKRMGEALRQAQKMEAVGTLAGGIAHDFNNLLMGIQGRASLISVDLDPDHPHAEHTAAIEAYVRSAVGLTKQLLGIVRGGKYEVKPVDVGDLLESTAAMFGRTRKQIRIRTMSTKQQMVIEADKRQIEQVLLNMYVNAWQAMPDGGDLHLETRLVELDEDTGRTYRISAGRYVKISLTDTGVGMTEEVRQKVFDPFFTTKTRGRGTGLGLASAYGIVRNHGGTITVYSEVGHGTTFNIYLPSSRREPLPEAVTDLKAVGGTETVLLVDDEEMILEVGKAMLERLGYRALTAASGKAAIERVSESGDGIDLVILDLIMPEIDGGKTFDRLREIRPSIPVILSSGYSINGQAAGIMERGCNGFIQKPFNLTDLAQKIRKVLEEDGIRQAGKDS